VPPMRDHRRSLQAVPAGYPMIAHNRHLLSAFTLPDWIRRSMGRLAASRCLTGLVWGKGLLMWHGKRSTFPSLYFPLPLSLRFLRWDDKPSYYSGFTHWRCYTYRDIGVLIWL
jgi:hypothetical protein